MRKFETPGELPPGYDELMVKLLHVQASSELMSVLTFRDYLDRAPTLDDRWALARVIADEMRHGLQVCRVLETFGARGRAVDRKSTRLNSSHLGISYAVFCLKKKNAVARAETITGKIVYLSPKRIRGDAVDRRSDLLSAGTERYALLTSRSLYSRGTTLAHIDA